MALADYSPEAAFKQNRRLCYQLIEQLESLIEGKLPANVDFTHVGNLVQARDHLEKAVRSLRSHGTAADRR